MSKSHRQRFREKQREMAAMELEPIPHCPRCGGEPYIRTDLQDCPVALECEPCGLTAHGQTWDEVMARWVGLR